MVLRALQNTRIVGGKGGKGYAIKGRFFLQILPFTMCTLHWLSFAGLVNFFQEICVRTAFEGKHFDMENVALCFCYCNVVNSSNLMNVHYLYSSKYFHLFKIFDSFFWIFLKSELSSPFLDLGYYMWNFQRLVF